MTEAVVQSLQEVAGVGGSCSTNESRLIERLRSGEPQAFEEFVQEFGGRMLVVARRMLGCEDESNDAVQDGFLSAFQALESFRGESQLGTWLHRIVVNVCLMRLRSRRRRRTVLIEDVLPKFDETGHHATPTATWQRTPDELLANAELRGQVRQCIDQLPDSFREILQLRDIEGIDTSDTARLLGVSESVVKTRLHRARQALKTLLEPLFAVRSL